MKEIPDIHRDPVSELVDELVDELLAELLDDGYFGSGDDAPGSAPPACAMNGSCNLASGSSAPAPTTVPFNSIGDPTSTAAVGSDGVGHAHNQNQIPPSGLRLEQRKRELLKPKQAPGSGKHSSKTRSRKQNSNSEPIVRRNGVEKLASSITKQRKLKSGVWEHLDKSKDANGKEWATCKNCSKQLVGSSRSGTTHLKNHLTICLQRNRNGAKLLNDSNVPGGGGGGNVLFDQEMSRLDLAKVIIKRQCPLNSDDHELLESLLNNFKTAFELPLSQENAMTDILHVYREEKDKLLRDLEKLSSGFSLGIELWTDDFKKSVYLFFTLHFIDGNWELKKKAFAVRKLSCCLTQDTFEIFDSIFPDKDLKRKLAFITMESSYDHRSTEYVSQLRKYFYYIPWVCTNSVCITSFLKLLVDEGLEKIEDILHKIRKSFKYTSKPVNKVHFQAAICQVKFQVGKASPDFLPMSDPFVMLENALQLREEFSVLEQIDHCFNSNPSMKEWDEAKVAYQCLKVINDAWSDLAGAQQDAANYMHYHVIIGMLNNLLQWEKSKDNFMCWIATRMRRKLKEACDESLVHKSPIGCLMIAAILDPRIKLDIEKPINALYGVQAAGFMSALRSSLVDTMTKYARKLSSLVSPASLSADAQCSATSYDAGSNLVDSFSRQSDFAHNANNVARPITELVMYLKEPKLPPNPELDVLDWWRVNTPKFPTLARVARVYLAVPSSIDQSSSNFLAEVRKINQAFDDPDPEIIEALICGKDWLTDLKQRSKLKRQDVEAKRKKDNDAVYAHPLSSSYVIPISAMGEDTICNYLWRDLDSERSSLRHQAAGRTEEGSRQAEGERLGTAYPAPRCCALQQHMKTERQHLVAATGRNGAKVVVDFGDLFATMHEMQSVKPGKWLIDLIIDIVVIRLISEAKKANPQMNKWYLPTYFSATILMGGAHVSSYVDTYQRNNQYMTTLDSCEQIFIPMNDSNKHWYLLIIDIAEKRIKILDTLPLLTEHRQIAVNFVVSFCDLLFEDISFNRSSIGLSRLTEWPVIVPEDVPRQQNCYDCGMYVISFMDKMRHMSYNHVSCNDDDRRKLAAELVLHPLNRVRPQILEEIRDNIRHQNLIHRGEFCSIEHS